MGLSVKETEAVKQMISRTHDRWALKYDKWATDAPRQFVLIGTTNDAQYLRDKTGNRRFWPIRVTKEINEARIKAIRDHLWGEAAYYEAAGESIELPRELWGDAAAAQAEREIVDAIEEALRPHLESRHGRIWLEDVWTLIGFAPDDQRRTDQALRTRMGVAMTRLGWDYDRKRKRYAKPGPPGSPDPDLTMVRDGGALAVRSANASLFQCAEGRTKVVKFTTPQRSEQPAGPVQGPCPA
jgi:predicted P-loop ATPase